MPRNYGVSNEAPYAAAPAVGLSGDTYYNTANKQINVSDGSAWNIAGGPSFAFRGTRTATLTTATSPAIVVFDGAPVNVGSCYNTTTGLYTVPYAGVYLAHGGVGYNVASSATSSIYIYKNGTVARSSSFTVNGFTETDVMLIDQCVAGDTLALWFNSSVSPVTSVRLATETYLQIARIG